MRSKRKSSDLFKRTKHWNGIEIIRINGDFSHSLATMEWEAAAAAAAEIDNNKKCSHDAWYEHNRRYKEREKLFQKHIIERTYTRTPAAAAAATCLVENTE